MGARMARGSSLYCTQMRARPADEKSGPVTLRRYGPPPVVAAWLFLAVSFVYVWLRIEPVLEYHRYGPYFYWHLAFLEPFLHRPGGLTNYASVLLSQLNCVSFLGALVFGLFQAAIFWAARICLARISDREPGLTALVPSFLLLLLRNRYGCPVVAIGLGLLLALGAAAGHLSLPWRRSWLSLALGGLVSGALFYLAGLWSALLYGALWAMFMLIRSRNWIGGLGCLALTLGVPLAFLGSGNLGIETLLNPWPEGVRKFLTAVLYASVPVTGAVLMVLPKPAIGGAAADLRRKYRAAGPAAVLLGLATVWMTFDQRQKLLAEIDYEASYGNYERVIAAAKQVKGLNHAAKVRLQLALYHTGRLAEELFSACDMVEETHTGETGEDCRAQSQPLLELGLVNDAEHMAHEALEMEGNRPDVLRQLARINLLKERPQAAQVFLNVLSLIPFQGERANAAWPSVGPELPGAERAFLDGMRGRVLTNDVVHDGLPVGRLLDFLLASNPTNRMAFEYAMADYLMELDLKSAVEHLRLLDNFSYANIPRPYEEALLVFEQRERVEVELNGRTIRPETLERFQQFKEAARQFSGTPEELAAMAANFGDTYWYYYYAALGHGRGEAQKAKP
jgi:hypothetical protein